MSYDFYAEVDTGGSEPHHIEPYFSGEHPAFDTDGMAGTGLMGGGRCGNYTSNVSPIWAKCLTATLGQVDGAEKYIGVDDRYCRERWPAYKDHPIATDKLCLRDLAGARMADIKPILHAAVEWGVQHVEELRELDPSNGWGCAEGAITYLWDIERFCDEHPNASLYISS